MDLSRSVPADGTPSLRRCGSTLVLGSGRQVRVLTLPATCGHRRLRGAWDACFAADHEGLVVWWPPDPMSN
jgi:hypothetical protein